MENSKKSGVGKTTLLVLIFLAVAVIISFFLIRIAMDLLGMGNSEESIEIHVPQGSSTTAIAELLEEEGIIDFSSMFVLYTKLRPEDNGLQAGDYVLTPSMSYDMISSTLATGTIKKEEVTITFYEGMSAREIANLLEEKDVCTAEDFYVALEGDYDYDFLEMVPQDTERFRQLEGYLFPDTYNFYLGESATSVVNKFLKNFDARVFPDVYELIEAQGMTLDDAINLAAIIQEEASMVEQMGAVSSVFHNRLNYPGMYPYLQSDVTIFYVEKDIKPFQDTTTQELYDQYNTYKCVGLPLGPICSPGLDAIKAAVQPDDTPYYFFVTDINGKYYYSVDAQTHYTNVRIAESVG